jgi:hypothetical protein
MKNKVAFDTELYVCVSDKSVQQDAEIQYYYSHNLLMVNLWN